VSERTLAVSPGGRLSAARAARGILGRVEAVVARGKRSGDAKAPGPVGRWVRDRLVMPLVAASMRRAGPGRDAWLTGHHIDWDSPVPA
jgi:hypothetical protein